MILARGPVTPLSVDKFDEVYRQWSLCGAVCVVGEADSGSEQLGDALVQRRGQGFPASRINVDSQVLGQRGGLLEMLGLLPGSPDLRATVSRTTEVLSRTIAPRTFIVHHAEHADDFSLLVLSTLARQNSTVKAIFIAEARRPVGVNLSRAGLAGVPTVCIPRVEGVQVENIVQRALGASPTALDRSLFEAWCGKSFKSLSWLIELVRVNASAVVEDGILHLRQFNVFDLEVPSWSIDDRLIGSDVANIIALSGSLPVAVLEELDEEARELFDLERVGLLDFSNNCVSIWPTVASWDVLLQQSHFQRRKWLHSLLPVLSRVGFDDVDALALAKACIASHVEIPAALLPHAIYAGVCAGDHDFAVFLANSVDHVPSATALADAAFACVVIDDPQNAACFARQVLEIDAPLSDLEATAMAMALGAARLPAELTYRQVLELLIGLIDSRCKRSADFLRLCVKSFEPEWGTSIRKLHESFDGGQAAHTNSRATVWYALKQSLDGCPLSSIETLASLVQKPEAAIDVAMIRLIGGLNALMVSDPSNFTEGPCPPTRGGPVSQVERVLWALLALERGTVLEARIILSVMLRDSGVSDLSRSESVLRPYLLAISAVVSGVCGDSLEASKQLVDSLRVRSTAPIVELCADYFRAMACEFSGSERLGNGDSGLDLQRLADASHAIGFRLLEICALYRLAHLVPVREGLPVWRRLAAFRASDSPPEGAPGAFVQVATAIEAHDAPALVEACVELHATGRCQDARLIASLLLGEYFEDLGGTPSNHALRRLKRIASGKAMAGSSVAPRQKGILTPKEVEVASLVVEGLADREIASRLGVSYRTVTTHVSRILNALGIARRHELTPELARVYGVPCSRKR